VSFRRVIPHNFNLEQTDPERRHCRPVLGDLVTLKAQSTQPINNRPTGCGGPRIWPARSSLRYWPTHATDIKRQSAKLLIGLPPHLVRAWRRPDEISTTKSDIQTIPNGAVSTVGPPHLRGILYA
jgi:hypothetical protein